MNILRKVGAFIGSNLRKVAVVVSLALGLGIASNASATTVLDGATTAMTNLSTDIVTASATVITAALAVGAVYFGGRSLWRFFKSLAR